MGPGAGSPLVISVAGVDVNGANYLQQVFNANTKTLQVWHSGMVRVDAPAAPGALPLPYPVADDSGRRFKTPDGTFPLFLVQGRRVDANDMRPAYRDIGYTGLGGLMTPWGQFIAWSQSQNIVPVSHFVNYCIFRNYG
jgi:hypothetical protein